MKSQGLNLDLPYSLALILLLGKAAPKPLQRERRGRVHRTGSCLSKGWKVFLLAVMVVATWQPPLILEVFKREIDWSIIIYVLTTPRTDTYCRLNSTLSHSSLCMSASFSCSQRQSQSVVHLNLPFLARLVSTQREASYLFSLWSESRSVVSDSLWPRGLYSAWILQARILEWVAFPFSRGSAQPRSPSLQADSLPAEPPGKPKDTGVGSLCLLQWIFLTQESNQGLLHCRWILNQLSD